MDNSTNKIEKQENRYTFQRGYVIYYAHPRFLRELKRLPLTVVYVSKRQKAIYCYSDERYEDKLSHQVRRARGKATIERAPLFDPSLNF